MTGVRSPRRLLPAAVVAALVAAPAAWGHAVLTPATLGAGEDVAVSAEIPNERRERATTSVTLRFPAGIAVVGTEEPGSWQAARTDRSATWTGGRITGERVVAFPLVLRATAPAGTYEVSLEQGYDDGETVTTTTQITVLPALGEATPEEHGMRAIVAAVVGVAVVAGSLVGLHVLRRRPSSKT